MDEPKFLCRTANPNRLRSGALAFALAALALPAQAEIIGLPGFGQGGSELIFIAWDNNGAQPKVAFVKDLGIPMDDFFQSGQQDAGSQFYWYLGGSEDPYWDTFTDFELNADTHEKVDLAKVKWTVFAYDGDGSDGALDDLKLFTTLRQAQSGDPATISGLSDVTSGAMAFATLSVQNFISGVNSQGSMPEVDNGSAVVNKEQGDSIFPFVNGATPQLGYDFDITYNHTIMASAGNLIGQSSWFYKINQGDLFDLTIPVAIDEFDNLGHDGYWGIAPASEAAHAGQYFLSYTLQAFESPAEQAQGIVAANSFARLAGILSLRSPAGRGQTVLDLTEKFIRGFVADAAGLDAQRLAAGVDAASGLGGAAVSAVPEPATVALWGAGAAALGWTRRRRRSAAHG